MWIAKLANLQSDYKKKKSVNYEEGQVRPVCDDKNCQSIKFINMWSVTKPNNMWLTKPAIQSSYQKSFCSDKKCQSTRCYKKKCPMRPVCDDKNLQSAKCAHMQQTAMLQSTYKKSSSKNFQVKSELA